MPYSCVTRHSRENDDLDYVDVNLDDNAVDAGDHMDTLYDRMEERGATLDMFGDDMRPSVSAEDLLGATLQQHALRKSMDSLDRLDDTYDSPAYEHVFVNSGLEEDVECTDI